MREPTLSTRNALVKCMLLLFWKFSFAQSLSSWDGVSQLAFSCGEWFRGQVWWLLGPFRSLKFGKVEPPSANSFSLCRQRRLYLRLVGLPETCLEMNAPVPGKPLFLAEQTRNEVYSIT